MLRAKLNRRIARTPVTEHEVQSSIHPELNFKRNSVNLLVGRRGTGKSHNVFREMSLMTQVTDDYSQLIYVTDKLSDDTFHKWKKHIKIPIVKVSYDDIQQCLQDIIEAKEDYKEIVEKELEDLIDDETRNRVLTTLDIKDFSRPEVHTAVFYDDAAEVFRNKKNKLSRLLFENRQPRITYFLALQDPFSLDRNVKSNLDTLWLFGGFDKQRFSMFFRQINSGFNEEEIYNRYSSLTMNQALVIHFEKSGLRITIIRD